MKRTTFNTRQENGDIRRKEGYLFRLPYPKRALFAIAKEGNNINSSIRWVVSEMSTGLVVAVGDWDDTRKAAIEKAAKILRRVGAKYFKECVEKEIMAHGKAN